MTGKVDAHEVETALLAAVMKNQREFFEAGRPPGWRFLSFDGGTEPIAEHAATFGQEPEPVSMLLWCPECGERHIDEGAFATKRHHTHACQHCGHVWRPAILPTVGVRFLPGFKNE